VGTEAGLLNTERPAFYAPHPGGWRDWWTILHPPYTAWHLSYVVIGACLSPRVDGGRLVATLGAFFFAVGIAAHALDELHGHPLRTAIPDRLLVGLAASGTAIACALGFVGVARVGPGLFVFIAIGPVLLVGYNLELFGGLLHTDLGFALTWGAFPVLVGYFVQAERLDLTAALAALAALGLSLAQRSLSTPARLLRRQSERVDGAIRMHDGSAIPLDTATLLGPLEHALVALSWSMIALALALVSARAF
jgi:hypothetical protein